VSAADCKTSTKLEVKRYWHRSEGPGALRSRPARLQPTEAAAPKEIE